MSARKAAVLVAAVAAAAIAVPLSVGSSHREAPNNARDPTADNTDVYASTAPDAPDALTIVSNWIPGQVPANGPNFFRFDDRARYYVNIDSKGDGKPNSRYLFRFKTSLSNPNSFLYAGPGTSNFGDPGLNVDQRYRVTHQSVNRSGKVTDSALFEADHGDPAQAVRLARGGWKAAPSVSSAEALAWALLADGKVSAAERFSREAMKLGSRNPRLLFHAGMIAAAVGDTARATRLLRRLVEQSPRFDPLDAPRAREAPRRLAG